MRKRILTPFFYVLQIILLGCANKASNDTTKNHLLSLEYKWLQAEFALDTSYLSSIIDSSFIGISGSGIQNKSEDLIGMYNNISQRLKDSIIIDSFKLENTVVNLYNDVAVVTFVAHTHGKNRRIVTERKTRFYDVWAIREGKWKAVASQGSKVE